ncbi:MAG: hypothetical protein JSW47_03255 [Phycisphaerales bacterium]|nr:MAG: hypothetical protein JSW47_03255 [Phycisphaerales bacterium]
MSPKLESLLFPALLALVSQPVTGSQAIVGVAARQDWIARDSVVVVDLVRPKALLDLLAGDQAIAFVTDLPAYKEQATKPKFQEFLNFVNFLETALDADWRTALGKLTGGGITLAVRPDETVTLIVDTEDEDLLRRLHEMLLNIARSEAEKKGQPNRVESKTYSGITAWTFDGKEAHAIIGKRLVMSNRPEGLKTILDLRAEAGGESLATNPAYEAARSQMKPGAVAAVFADLQVLTQAPNIAGLLKRQDENPLAALVFTGIAEAIRDSSWLALGLHIEDQTLICRASVEGKTATRTSPAAFAFPKKKDEGALPNLVVPRRIAAMTLYRDLHKFYAAKDNLFPERTSGLIFFENMMGIFFSGRDLTNEVLVQTRPEIRLVVAEQQFDPSIGTPAVKLPAFALILRLRDEEEFDEIAEEAWQKAIGLVNFTRGQQAMPGLIIDRPMHGNTKMTVSYFSTAEIEDRTKLAQRFNVRPTLAMPGDYLILSSTDGLARDLIDAVNDEIERQVEPLAQIHSLVEIEGGRLASILDANRDTLVRGNMIKKGSTKEQAESEIDVLTTLARLCERLRLSIGMNEGITEASLEMKLNLQ